MNLRNTLALMPGMAWIYKATTRAAHRPLPLEPPGANVFGAGIGNQAPTDVLLAESAGIFDAGTRAIADRIAGLRFEVKSVRRVRDGTEEEETLDDHPLAKLLERPHPSWSRSQLMFVAARQIMSAGEAYWLKVGNGLGVPVELHPLPPSQMTPLVSTGVVSAYRFVDGHGKAWELPANVVIRAYFPDPENPWGAEGYLGPVALEADATKFAHQHLRYHYQHDATPKTTLQAGPEAAEFSADARAKFEQLWRERYHGRSGSNVGIPIMTPRGYELIVHAMQTGADITPLLEFWRDDLLMSVRVPRSILGQVVSGDRSSAEVNQYVFDRYAVQPVARLIADAMTLQLAPDFDADLRVCFEDFVDADKEFELAREAHDLEHALRTPNKVLTDRGDDEVEWGDTPLMASKLAPYDPEMAAAQAEVSLQSAQKLAAAAPLPKPGAMAEDDERAERREHAAIRAKYREKRKGKRAA